MALTKCVKCEGSGQLTADADEMPLSVVQKKEKERDVWRGLVRRLKWKPCPDCGGPGKDFGRTRKKRTAKAPKKLKRKTNAE